MKKITIRFAPDGTTKIKTEGFAGADCLKATAPFEKLLGDVTSDEKTAEFLQAPQEAHVKAGF